LVRTPVIIAGALRANHAHDAVGTAVRRAEVKKAKLTR
jgi:hypothetical protein